MALLSPKIFSFSTFFFSILFFSSVFAGNNNQTFSTQQCIHEHFSALLHLKNGFYFSDKAFTNLSSWNSNNTDCCFWEGITCDGATGHVVSFDLSEFFISGRVDFESLFRLQSLQRLNLAFNEFDASPIPSGFEQLTSLTHLNLGSLHFYGQIPLEISNLTSLVSLDLSYNHHSANDSINVPLKLENPNIRTLVQNLSSLRELHLDNVNISAQGSEWGQALFMSLPRLRQLTLQYCGLSGSIHSSLSRLRFLSQLDLSANDLSGSLPSFHVNLTKLEYLDLSFNSFSGPIPSSYGNELLNLKEIMLLVNFLNGTIPASLFSIPTLQMLDLSKNELGGRLDVIHNASSTQLEHIYLGNNNLQGMVPSFIFKLPKLRTISLLSNNFSGVVELGLFQNLKNLSLLDLSDNNLFIKDSNDNSTIFSFSQIRYLSMRSCNVSKFPNFLRNQEQMVHLDLSNNRINGGIPKWIWNVGNKTLYYLNLSHNALQGIEPPFLHVSFTDQAVLDLSSNMLEGSLPSVPPSSSFFSFSNNRLSGEIPMSICDMTSLEVLNLSKNQLTGWIPQCLSEITDSLNVLNLRGNAFSGTLLQTFKESCNLQTLDLSENQLEGQVPRSLANCTMLEVLNLGNNQINDTFPTWVEALSHLRILVLKSNKFYGPITLAQTNLSFPMLQIIDLSSNCFMGGLPSNMF
ncbi:receptor-like protein 7 [Magnolia sinica]|uniref:receptor-like protein 7 n=1 Tax=Magnolia sinica TaxID=86752 RepID=UPI0026584EB2|nr:receptor-like protein 7 [Magnolia sinica]